MVFCQYEILLSDAGSFRLVFREGKIILFCYLNRLSTLSCPPTGDIIKTTLSKARENNKVNCAKTMVQSLITKFKEVQQAQGVMKVDRNTVEFHSLKELAKRFALSFGLDALKNREAVTQLHRESILFSLHPLENPDDPTGPPPNVAFLEIAAEFTNKLLKQDKKVVLNYLDKRLPSAMPSR